MNNSRFSAYVFRLVLYLSFFLSGGSALIYQIVWTRQCMLLLGSTAYAVSTVLSIFFLGLGLGSFIGGKLAERTSNPMRWYAGIEVLIGLWAWVVIDIVSNRGAIVLSLIQVLPDNEWFLFLLRVSIAIFWFALPSLCMGMTFPLLVRYEQTLKRKTRRYISLLYSINTLGAVLGAFLAGFILIPTSGYAITFYIAIAISWGVGIIAWLISQFQEAMITQEGVREENIRNRKRKRGKCKCEGSFFGVIHIWICMSCFGGAMDPPFNYDFFRDKLCLYLCINFCACWNSPWGIMCLYFN